jgi:hypothetical protein
VRQGILLSGVVDSGYGQADGALETLQIIGTFKGVN